MTAYTGYLPPSNLFGASPTRPSFYSSIGTWTPFNVAHLPALNAASGTWTNNQPITLRGANFTGYVAPGVNDVFYNRILIEPASLDFGSIVSAQSRNLTVFNGFLSSKTLASIDENGFDAGMSLIGDTPPVAFGPLVEKTYTVSVELDGAPQIDANATFNFTGLSSITVPITGSRIVLLPVGYRTRAVETLIWQTDILTAYTGGEQRLRLRIAPRQQLKIEAYLDGYNRTRVENLLIGWRKRIWAVPMWMESRQVTSAVAQDDSTINVDTRWGDFRIDGLAVLWENHQKYDVFSVSGVTDTTLTLTRGVNDDYSASAIVMPVRSAYMLSDPTRTTSGYDAILKADLEVTDNIRFDPDPAAIQYNGEDFYDIQPLYDGDGADDSYEHRIEKLDYSTGPVSLYAPWDQIKINRTYDLVLEGLEDIWNHRLWLHRRAGRLRPFYTPTYENNFRLLSSGTLGDSIEVESNAYTTQGYPRNHIGVKLRSDGSYIFREVTAVEDTPGGTTNLTLDTALNIQASDVDEISFVGLKRLDSDRQTLTWEGNNVAITQITTKEIEH